MSDEQKTCECGAKTERTIYGQGNSAWCPKCVALRDDQTYAALRDDLAVARRLAGLLIPDNDGELVFTKPNIRIRMRR